jgi:uronate dehydrogenase
VASSSATSVVAVRIGYFALRPPSGPDASARDVAAWLSPRDCGDLLRAAVEAEWDHDGIGFAVANGISANRYRLADLTDTVDRLGYRPVDDAWASD